EKYESCGGLEHFISVEDTTADTLIGFLRLRFPANPHRSELKDAAIVRELHVYGSLVPVGTTAKTGQWQHKGSGEKLLEMAEEVAKDAGYSKMAIISGIGVREYYMKFGYELDGPYMSKAI
ncbi:MAG: GNAT family N-acetyltransferase, partial [Methanosarcinales archaeon]|nr:GNAT family N-acetyltransferase [Methanosarcinales archaeon]